MKCAVHTACNNIRKEGNLILSWPPWQQWLQCLGGFSNRFIGLREGDTGKEECWKSENPFGNTIWIPPLIFSLLPHMTLTASKPFASHQILSTLKCIDRSLCIRCCPVLKSAKSSIKGVKHFADSLFLLLFALHWVRCQSQVTNMPSPCSPSRENVFVFTHLLQRWIHKWFMFSIFYIQ